MALDLGWVLLDGDLGGFPQTIKHRSRIETSVPSPMLEVVGAFMRSDGQLPQEFST
jgi:hypothetical protein